MSVKLKMRGGPDAYYVDEPLPVVGRVDIEALKTAIPQTTFGRTRLCAHQSADTLQEMFIVVSRESYIRPHRHLGKVESLLVLDGVADAVFFDESGDIARVARLGAYASGHPFFYRIGDGVFHTLVIRTESLVFKEATLGPFDRANTQFASWAPEADQRAAVQVFTADLAARVSRSEAL